MNAHAVWKVERDQILKETQKSKGEKRVAAQVDLEALGREPEAPPSADRTVSEPTFEGLTKLLAQGQPSLGLFSDEGGQFLGGHAMNSENRQKTLAAFNDLWQGNQSGVPAPVMATQRSLGGGSQCTSWCSRALRVSSWLTHWR